MKPNKKILSSGGDKRKVYRDAAEKIMMEPFVQEQLTQHGAETLVSLGLNPEGHPELTDLYCCAYQEGIANTIFLIIEGGLDLSLVKIRKERP